MKERRSLGIIGGTGLVGEETTKLLREKGIEVIVTDVANLDITNGEEVKKFIHGLQSDSVILMAAYTNVEGAQKDPALAELVNIDGTRNVAEACRECGKFLVYISTDFVFKGTSNDYGPYKEDDKTADINSRKIGEYARSKLKGEQIILEGGGKSAIVRISYPFGNVESDRDFIRKTIGLLENGYSLFSDQRFTPTYIPDLAVALEKITTEQLTGIFHVATYPVTTPYEFGSHIALMLGMELPEKGSLEVAMRGRTPKPLLGGLSTDQTQKRLATRFHKWKTAIAEELLLLFED